MQDSNCISPPSILGPKERIHDKADRLHQKLIAMTELNDRLRAALIHATQKIKNQQPIQKLKTTSTSPISSPSSQRKSHVYADGETVKHLQMKLIQAQTHIEELKGQQSIQETVSVSNDKCSLPSQRIHSDDTSIRQALAILLVPKLFIIAFFIFS